MLVGSQREGAGLEAEPVEELEAEFQATEKQAKVLPSHPECGFSTTSLRRLMRAR